MGNVDKHKVTFLSIFRFTRLICVIYIPTCLQKRLALFKSYMI